MSDFLFCVHFKGDVKTIILVQDGDLFNMNQKPVCISKAVVQPICLSVAK